MKLLNFIKKYAFNIIFLILISVPSIVYDLYILPKEKNYYQARDIDLFIDANYIYIILVLFGILLLVFHKQFLKTTLKHKLNSLIGLIIFIPFVYIPFKAICLSIILPMNRTYNIDDQKASFKILYKMKFENDYIINLYEINEKMGIDDLKIDAEAYHNLKKYDTITVGFKVGQFGIRHSLDITDTNTDL